MKHHSIKEMCESLGLTVRQEPADGRANFSATFEQSNVVRVYWSISTSSAHVLGLPRVIVNGRDTHARNLQEIKYLVNLSR